MKTRIVTVLLYDDIEVLDFAGPFEVFGVTGRRGKDIPFTVRTVTETGRPIAARNQLHITPSGNLESASDTHVLVIPGGYGSRREMHNEPLLRWIADRSKNAEVTLSVCTGALLLGAAGLLDNLDATTHHGAFDLLETTAPKCRVRRDERIVDNGRIVTSAGISAGLDASLHIVARLCGMDVAQETAAYMEYDWRRPALSAHR